MVVEGESRVSKRRSCDHREGVRHKPHVIRKGGRKRAIPIRAVRGGLPSNQAWALAQSQSDTRLKGKIAREKTMNVGIRLLRWINRIAGRRHKGKKGDKRSVAFKGRFKGGKIQEEQRRKRGEKSSTRS